MKSGSVKIDADMLPNLKTGFNDPIPGGIKKPKPAVDTRKIEARI